MKENRAERLESYVPILRGLISYHKRMMVLGRALAITASRANGRTARGRQITTENAPRQPY